MGNDPKLKLDLLKYFHNLIEGVHSRIDATIRKISAVVYWKGLKKEVRLFVLECEVCQKCKHDLSAYPGLSL